MTPPRPVDSLAPRSIVSCGLSSHRLCQAHLSLLLCTGQTSPWFFHKFPGLCLFLWPPPLWLHRAPPSLQLHRCPWSLLLLVVFLALLHLFPGSSLSADSTLDTSSHSHVDSPPLSPHGLFLLPILQWFSPPSHHYLPGGRSNVRLTFVFIDFQFAFHCFLCFCSCFHCFLCFTCPSSYLRPQFSSVLGPILSLL